MQKLDFFFFFFLGNMKTKAGDNLESKSWGKDNIMQIEQEQNA